MGVRMWWSFFVLLWVYFFVIWSASADSRSICNVKGCNCTVTVALWKTINCTLSADQSLNLKELNIPHEAAEIFFTGGYHLIFGEKAFYQLNGLTLLHVKGIKTLEMKKQSFHNITTPSLLIQIQNCDQLSLETYAFENVQSSIEIEVLGCMSVRVEKMAFNKLRSALFKDIPSLVLSTESFVFKNQGIIGRHGPVTTIFFDNIQVSTIPKQTFVSTLAEVRFQKSKIGEIESDAFSPLQISSMTFLHTKIDTIRNKAFISRMLIYNFTIYRCQIKQLESGAISASMANLTVQFSRITAIQKGAINSTVATVRLSDNHIDKLETRGVILQDWNRINFGRNIIKFLNTDSIVAPVNSDVLEFVFNGNEIVNFQPGALSFVPQLPDQVFIFKDNFFEQTCHCTLDEWAVELIAANVTSKTSKILNNSFCRVNDLLANCFELKVGVIAIQNFTKLVCNTSNNLIVCERYHGETKVVNTTITNSGDEDLAVNTDWLTVIIGTSAILALLIIVTFIIMLIRGSRWLKRKGYFRKMQYMQNEVSIDNDEENTIETVDEGDKLDISEDLTMELLQDLSRKLDDPMTHQEACETIEQLYQRYIHHGGFENNNQEEDAHLYEELGNLQANNMNLEVNPPESDARSILKIMEEKFNTHFEDIDAEEDLRPPLVQEYSEPSDAAVHLYSEIRNNKDVDVENNKDSLKSRASSTMAFRPLPDKPGSSKML